MKLLFHPVRGIVQWFAQYMEMELKANDHKGGWSHREAKWLVKRLRQEVDELEKAINTDAETSEVVAEAADVANFAMMIADVVTDEAAFGPLEKGDRR